MNFKRIVFGSLALMLAIGFFATQLPAQTQTTGDISGVVTDQSGAVVPQAKVTLKDNAKGSTQDSTSSKDGTYRFFLLPPGSYSVTASAQNFQAVTRPVDVSVGQIATVNIQLALASANTTVTVTEEAPLIQTENGNMASTIGEQAISQSPNPGNDLSAIAQLTPGTVMNTSSGLGNFSSFGISATANLFTIDGMDDNDPFLNLNNTGATNLALGTNEIQEATVVANGYTGQYGSLAGANINYVTKSGGNQFHGNAIYFWNGSSLNANDFFNAGVPKPFSNANQWAGSLGGPIKKDKAFFFFNTEGLRVILPTTFPESFVPTQEFETATIDNLTKLGLTKSIPFYQQMFGLYNASTVGRTLSTPIACPLDAKGISLVTGATNCTQSFQGTASNLTHEYQIMGRVDYNIGQNDRAFIRVAYDKGHQASVTDPISPLFNVESTQPQWSAQFNETHTFGSNTTNQFIASLLWYSAIFGNANTTETLAAFPTTVGFNDGSLTNMGGICCGGLGNFNFPQGRNVTQYQFSDDVSHTWGKHTLGFGFKFRRNDVSDHDFAVGNSGFVAESSLVDFFNGGGTDSLVIAFPQAPVQPIALYTLGFYGQDDWRIKSNFTLSLSLRLEHQSNPVCQTNCFARFDGPFTGADHNPDTPYNQVIHTGLHQMFPGLDSVLWQPRIGFAWQPFGNAHNTVIRGGVGLFYDAFAGVLVDAFAGNSPNVNTFVTAALPISPAETVGGNLFSAAATNNAAFINAFNTGGTVGDINAAVPGFIPPNFSFVQNQSHIPQYQKWNLEVQQGIGRNSSVTVGYVGNHGIHEIIQNAALNAFCDPTVSSDSTKTACPGVPFVGLPAAVPDQRFGTVTQYSNGAISNYNGLTASFVHRFTGITNGQVSVNYLYGHAFDFASNGGLTAIPFSFSNSFATPTDPNNPRGSYGPADYDVRQNISGSYVLSLPIRTALKGHGWAPLVEGWQVSGTVFYHTGLPFTVFENRETGLLVGNNYGSFLYPAITGPGPTSCGQSATTTPCFAPGQFIPPDSSRAFTSGLRNHFRGPGYADTDFAVTKNTKIPGWERGTLGIGFQFYNLFNHPNFFSPVSSSSSGSFGLIQSTTSAPTSILGSGLGGDSSPRIIQLKAQFSF